MLGRCRRLGLNSSMPVATTFNLPFPFSTVTFFGALSDKCERMASIFRTLPQGAGNSPSFDVLINESSRSPDDLCRSHSSDLEVVAADLRNRRSRCRVRAGRFSTEPFLSSSSHNGTVISAKLAASNRCAFPVYELFDIAFASFVLVRA